MSRITYGMINTNVQAGIQANASRVNQTMTQLSTGKAISRPSDDSVNTSVALQIRSDLKGSDQYYRNMQDGLGWLSTGEAALSTGNDVLQRARELGIQGANDTYSALERDSLRKEVRSLAEQMVSIANTNYQGEYIFSGTQTQEPPYSLVQGSDRLTNLVNANGTTLTAVPTTISIYDTTRTDSNTTTGNPTANAILPGSLTVSGLTEGTDYTVDYVAGNITFLSAAATAQAAGTGIDLRYDWVRRNEKDMSGDVVREVQRGETVKVNVKPDEAFGKPADGTVFDSLIGIMQGLHVNNGGEVRSKLAALDVSIKEFLDAQTIAGSRANRLDYTTTQNRTDKVTLTSESSRIEDIDFAEVISDFQTRQQIYQASIQVGAQVIQPSLADYL